MEPAKLFIWLARYLDIILIVLNVLLVFIILSEWKEHKFLVHRRKLIRGFLNDATTPAIPH